MDSRDLSAISSLVSILRTSTRYVRCIPFFYLLVYSVCLLLEPVADGLVVDFINLVFFLSPAVSVLMLLASSLFKLCVWHKIAIAIPLLSQAESVVDSCFLTLSISEVVAINSSLAAISILFILIAFIKFIVC